MVLGYYFHMDDTKPRKESLADLLRQAKRAQQIVAAVDFKKIASHDPDEVAKLDGVREALDKIAEGKEVDRVEGVDEVRNTDPRQAWVTALMDRLDDAGYSDRVGRVFAIGAGEERGRMKPLDMVPHREGVPLFDLCLAPNYAPSEGAHALFISATGVFSAHAAQPFNRHKWKILRSQRYDSEAEMLAIVGHYLNPPEA